MWKCKGYKIVNVCNMAEQKHLHFVLFVTLSHSCLPAIPYLIIVGCNLPNFA